MERGAGKRCGLTSTLVLRYYAEPMISSATSAYPYLETEQGRVIVEVDPR